jgi:hypothetical protein
MTGETFERLRIAIVGSCQVGGLAATARRMLPGADVQAWHVGVHPTISDEELLALLPEFDVVIDQISDHDGHPLLQVAHLREVGLPVIFLPMLVFTGFHPDIAYIRGSGGPIRGLETNYHSIIVAAAFTLGLPANRVTDLFNALVFAELGYFDVFDAAKVALINNFDQVGFNLRPLFDVGLKEVGQFMYTIDHPHVLALALLCRLALARAGFVDPATPLPNEIGDYLAGHFVWPTYPALAKRIGVAGSTTFLLRNHDMPSGYQRELPLSDYVSASFCLYDSLPKETLRHGPVGIACERLSGLVVR